MKDYQYRHQRRVALDKKKREERKKEKRDGRLVNRRLAFLLKLKNLKRLSYAKMSALTGFSPQNLHRIFEVEDDIKLSKATEMCRSLGYELSFTIRWQGNSLPRNPDSSRMPREVKEAAADPTCRLHQLAFCLIQREYSVLSFSRNTGLDRGTIYRPFREAKDDIFISSLLIIVEAMGCSITWILTKVSGTGTSVIKIPAKRRKEALR